MAATRHVSARCGDNEDHGPGRMHDKAPHRWAAGLEFLPALGRYQLGQLFGFLIGPPVFARLTSFHVTKVGITLTF